MEGIGTREKEEEKGRKGRISGSFSRFFPFSFNPLLLSAVIY